MIMQAIDVVLHLNLYLQQMVEQYHQLTYGIIALVLFCETGLVITPFLPGDSLLFGTGAVFASSALNIHLMFLIAIIAVFLGDNTNYWLGRWIGNKLLHAKKSRWFNPEHLHKTHAFYEKYGLQAIIIARFIPIVRTFMPFVAGLSYLTYRRFILMSLLAALIWVGLLLYAGYWLGSIEVVKNNFSIVIMAIILLSVLPPIVTFARHRLRTRA